MSEIRSVFDTSPSASRREQLLTVASRLFAEFGYHAVGIDDIGEAAGITGPAIYRHFNSKSAVLAALLNKLTDQLVTRSAHIVATHQDSADALRHLVRYQTEMCVYDRALMAVYLTEFRSLPGKEQLDLRLKQRAYLFDWMRTLGGAQPACTEAELRALVQAAIAVSQSVIYYRTPLSDEDLIDLVANAAESVLGLTKSDTLGVASASSE